MSCRSTNEKQEILAMVAAFPHSGLQTRITGNIAYHFNSFVGRDFKGWLQIAPFIIPSYVTDNEKKCWLFLCKVHVYVLIYVHEKPFITYY